MGWSRKDEAGAVAVVMAICLSAFLLVVASLVVDLGLARDTRSEAQNAADASALAAGNALYPSSTTPDIPAAVTAAKEYARENFGTKEEDWADCEDPAPLAFVAPSTECISFSPNATAPTKVRVLIPARVVVARLNAGQRLPIAAVARATLKPNLTQPCGLCVLGSGVTHNFQNGDAVVNGADIYINGSSSVSNQGLVSSTGSIYVEGQALGGTGQYTPDAIQGVEPIPDPLDELVVPPDMTGLAAQSNPCTHGPGIYTGQNLRNITCNLQPGLYVVRAGTWDLSGNASTNLNGTGVTIYLTCSTGTAVRECNPGEAGATIDASGNGNLNLKGPTTGPLQGVTILMDRQNTATLRLTGNGALGTTGAIYAKSGRLQGNGNGCANGINSMIVVKDIEFNGNPACLTINYTVAQNPKPKPSNLALDE